MELRRWYAAGLAALVLGMSACSSGAGKQSAPTTTGVATTRVAPTRPAGQNARTPAAAKRGVVFHNRDVGDLLGVPVPDPHSGIWFLIGRATKVDLDHLDAAGTLSSIALPKAFAGGSANSDPGLGEHDPTLAVDPDGTVWVLGPRALAEATAGASTAKLIPFGPLPDNHDAELSQPLPVRGGHAQQVLASDGSGHVAFALTATSIIREYTAGTGRFTDLELPTGADAMSLRYFADGGLAIGIDNFVNGDRTHAIVAPAEGALSAPIEVGNAEVLNPYSGSAVIAGAFPGRTILNRDGTTTAIALPVSGPAPTGGVQRGKNGTLVVPSQPGITIVKSASDPVVTATLHYAGEPCPPTSGGGFTGPTGPGGRAPVVHLPERCFVVPDHVLVGSDGSIWQLITEYNGTPGLTIERVENYSARPVGTGRIPSGQAHQAEIVSAVDDGEHGVRLIVVRVEVSPLDHPHDVGIGDLELARRERIADRPPEVNTVRGV